MAEERHLPKGFGSYYGKVLRVQRVASWMCETIRQRESRCAPASCTRPAVWPSGPNHELVKEFTELQGIVGGLYARVQQLDPDLPEATRLAIADTIYDHYNQNPWKTQFRGPLRGRCFRSRTSGQHRRHVCLGLQPTGSKDPFALRRQATASSDGCRAQASDRLTNCSRRSRSLSRVAAEKKFSATPGYSHTVKHFCGSV